MFTTIFPITFLSNAFARTDVMPSCAADRLAEWNPISALSQALRDNWGIAGIPVRADVAVRPLHNPEAATIIWTIGLSAILAPLAIRAYVRRTTD